MQPAKRFLRTYPHTEKGASMQPITTEKERLGPARLRLASLFVTAIAALIVSGIKPAVVSAYITLLKLPPREAGYLISLEMTGATIGTLASGFLLRRLDTRSLVQVALLILLAAHVSSMVVSAMAPLFALRAISGLAAGTCVGVAIAGMSRMSSPDRVFGAYTVIMLLLYAGVFALLPLLLARFGIAALFGFMACAVAIALLLSGSFPLMRRINTPDISVVALRTASSPIPTMVVLCGTLLFYSSFGGLWAFIVEIGKQTSLTAAGVGGVMSLSQMLGAAAAFLPVLLARKLGRTLPIALALALAIGSVLLLSTSTRSAHTYALAVPATMAGLMLLFPYLMGTVSDMDDSGRLSTVCIALQSIGLAAGPAWAGRLVQAHGFHPLLFTTAAGYAAALSCLLPVTLRQDHLNRTRGQNATDSGDASRLEPCSLSPKPGDNNIRTGGTFDDVCRSHPDER
jgi:predicted MFS family arabinose efflux permease